MSQKMSEWFLSDVLCPKGNVSVNFHKLWSNSTVRCIIDASFRFSGNLIYNPKKNKKELVKFSFEFLQELLPVEKLNQTIESVYLPISKHLEID